MLAVRHRGFAAPQYPHYGQKATRHPTRACGRKIRLHEVHEQMRQHSCARWDGAGDARVLHARVEVHSRQRGAEQACCQQRAETCRCARGRRHAALTCTGIRELLTAQRQRSSRLRAPTRSETATTKPLSKIRSRADRLQTGDPRRRPQGAAARNVSGSHDCVSRCRKTSAVIQCSWMGSGADRPGMHTCAVDWSVVWLLAL